MRVSRFARPRATRLMVPGLFVAAAAVVLAAVPRLVQDINTTITPQDAFPRMLGRWGNQVLFGGIDATGDGLWQTDGTTQGTTLIERVQVFWSPERNNFVRTAARAFFIGGDADAGFELWRTDGTAAGTERVLDLFAGTESSQPWLNGAVDNELLFSAIGANGARQIYLSGGTAATTRAITNFPSTSVILTDSLVWDGARRVFFLVFDGTVIPCCRNDVWVADLDGTTARRLTTSTISNVASLRKVGDSLVFTASVSGSSPDSGLYRISLDDESVTRMPLGTQIGQVYAAAGVEVLGDVALFMAATDTHGDDFGLWRTDGMTATLVDPIDPGPGGAVSRSTEWRWWNFGSYVVFTATDASGLQLWSSDGTQMNTRRLTQAPDRIDPAFNPKFFFAGRAGSSGFFSVWNGTSFDVWRTNPSAPFSEAVPSLAQLSISVVGLFRAMGDEQRAFFAVPGTGGPTARLRAYSLATRALTDVRDLGTSYFFETFLLDGARLYFSFYDPLMASEPWVTDGTPSGTRLLRDLAPETRNNDSDPAHFAALGERVLFAADDGVHGRELWESDGTSAGTRLSADIAAGLPGSTPLELFATNEAVYFFAVQAGTWRFMRKTAGTPAPTVLADLVPPSWEGNTAFQFNCPEVARRPVMLGGRVFFGAIEQASGHELWVTDGTAAGTTRVSDIAPAGDGSEPCWLTVFNGRVFFQATAGNANGGWELYSTDGTLAGTSRVIDIEPNSGFGSFPSDLRVFNGALYFRAFETDHGSELWRSDGTASGTALVTDLFPGRPSSVPKPVGTLNNRLLFTVLASGTGPDPAQWRLELYSTDGTAAGTSRVSSRQLSGTSPLLVNGGHAFFRADDGTNGTEPWVTDGTEAGTRMLVDIHPGGGSSNPAWFHDFRGVTLFAAQDPARGMQLWRTDGNPAGTRLVADIGGAPGANLAQGRGVAGHQFFFVDTAPTTGDELYTLENERPIAANDAGTSTNSASVTIDVLANDSDPDGSLVASTLRVTSQPGNGQVTVNAGQLTYQPAAGFSGTDSFTYAVDDNQGRASGPGTVLMTVTAAPAPPQATSGGGGGGSGSLAWTALALLAAIWALRQCASWLHARACIQRRAAVVREPQAPSRR